MHVCWYKVNISVDYTGKHFLSLVLIEISNNPLEK